MAETQRASLRIKPPDSPSIPRPDLLPGELMVCEVPNVLRFDAMGENKHGISGVLCATNFRVSFITAGMYGNKRQSIFHSNPDLSEDTEGFASQPQSQDAVLIPQACIMHICNVHGEKVKKINPGHVFKSKLETLVIHCKDFRIISFGFKFCSKEHQRKIVNAILHYSYPSSISRLFAFDYDHSSAHNSHSNHNLFPTYRSISHWERELERLNSNDMWRVTEANIEFAISDSLGQYMVCPKGLRDDTISVAAAHYTNRRLPFWCWNHPMTGVPLLCSTGL
jgi:myotubularin-related protein 10/11/12